MNLFAWLGRKIRLTDRAFWASYYGGDTWSGESINPETAMQISAFWACVRLISQTIGTLPLGVYERLDDGSRKARGDHYLYRLVHDQPNADHTAVEFWEGIAACLCLSGNAFALKAYRGTGASRQLVALTLLNPAFMNVDRQANGTLLYKYSGDPRGVVRDYREDEIFHVRGFGIGGDLGLSPIAYARQSLSANRATERAAATTFANGMRASGILTWKGGGILTPDQAQQIRKNRIDPMSGSDNAGKTMLLEGDFDYRQLSIPPETAQLLETRQFGVAEVCRIHGVPPIMIGHSSPGQTMFGAGVSEVILGWYTLGLRPILKRIEAAARSLFPPGERDKLYVEFGIEGLLRADWAARGEFYWKLVQVAGITPNQICDKENFPRFPGGNRHYVNQTLAPLDEEGVPVKAGIEAPAGRRAEDQNPQRPQPGQRPALEVVQ